jgi:hypothetical protein
MSHSEHPIHDPIQWRVNFSCAKFDADIDAYREKYGKEEGERRFFAEHAPVETVEGQDNLLMYGGASCLWEALIGNGTATAGQNLTFFNNANAAIGVGDSTVAEAATQTDLQAATNKTRQGMNTGYPQHTDGTVSSANTITFQSTFGGSSANYSWNEWSVFNSSTNATGRMLNRRVPSGGLGVKSAGSSWTFTITITLS